VAELAPLLYDSGGWLVQPGLRSSGDLDEVRRYRRRLRDFEEVDLLFIETHDVLGGDLIAPPSGFGFCGYDYGSYLGAWDHFSVLANDVYEGRYDALSRFSRDLNPFLLCEDLELVRRISASRKALMGRGAQLEDHQEFVAIAIYSDRVEPAPRQHR
jgi:hypothetical protein